MRVLKRTRKTWGELQANQATRFLLFCRRDDASQEKRYSRFSSPFLFLQKGNENKRTGWSFWGGKKVPTRLPFTGKSAGSCRVSATRCRAQIIPFETPISLEVLGASTFVGDSLPGKHFLVRVTRFESPGFLGAMKSSWEFWFVPPRRQSILNGHVRPKWAYILY